jgi:tetratricopeptide (TPR) repeat protein
MVSTDNMDALAEANLPTVKLSPPDGARLPLDQSRLVVGLPEPQDRRLRTSLPAFHDLSIKDPAQERLRKYQDDEQHSILTQAQVLAQGHPTSPVAWARLSQALAIYGKPQDAADAARRSLENLRQGSVDRDAAIKSSRVIDHAALFVSARVLVSVGSASDAEEWLLRFDGLAPLEHCLLAALAEARGDRSLAFERLVGVPGVDAAAYRGYLLVRGGQYEEAIRELRIAGGESANNPSLLVNLAYAYSGVGSLRKAVAASRQAALLAPKEESFRLNLVAYLIAAGNFESARSELSSLKRLVGDSPDLDFIQAHLSFSEGKVKDGTREIRRALRSSGDSASTGSSAKLAARKALLEWHSGKIKRSDYLRVLNRALQQSRGEVTLDLALLYCDGMNDTGVLPEVIALYEELSSKCETDTLLPLAVRIDLMRGEFLSALEKARRFRRLTPLDPNGTRLVIDILGLALADLPRAAAVALDAIRRTPGQLGLGNTLAFPLGMTGKFGVAERVLDRISEEDGYTLATRGLLCIGRGDLKEGLRYYDKASDWGRSLPDPWLRERFEALLLTYESIVVRIFMGNPFEELELRARRALPEDWKSDVAFRMLAPLASRCGLRWFDGVIDADRDYDTGPLPDPSFIKNASAESELGFRPSAPERDRRGS